MTDAETPDAYDLRAEAYARSRPGYPVETIDALRRGTGLKPSHVVADVGSGHGPFAKLFLENGNEVYGVEPGEGMRTTAERLLKDYPRFTSVAGTAESTSLPDSSMDLVTGAQALTWFDPEPTRREFQRILKPGGHLAFVWYQPKGDTPWMQESGALFGRWSEQYAGNVQARYNRTEVLGVLLPERSETTFDREIAETWERSLDAYVSTSYVPLPDTPNGAREIEDLRALFELHQVNGLVQFRYVVKLCWGTL